MAKEFAKYFIVGGSSFVLDLVSLVFIKEYLGLAPYVAVLINQGLVICFGYGLNRFWTFRSQGMAHTELVRYVSVFGLNYILAVIVMFVFNEKLGFDYIGVRIANIALSVSWNFMLYRVWVFKKG